MGYYDVRMCLSTRGRNEVTLPIFRDLVDLHVLPDEAEEVIQVEFLLVVV